MRRAETFGRFLVRFWPLWLPLLLLFTLPPARPFSRVVSDDLVNEISRILSGQDPRSSMPQSGAYPSDFDLQLWDSWNQNRRNFSYDYAQSPTDDALSSQLRKQFSDEPLLIAPPLQHEMGMSSWVEPWYDYASPPTAPAEIARELKRLRAAATRGGQLQPDNAFWWVALAHIEWRAKRYNAALRALERAAKCSHYDDYTLEMARRLIRARQRYGDPSFFDKLEVMEDARSSDDSKLGAMAQLWGAHARRLRNKGDAPRALRWAGALVVTGDLMQRDPNSWPTAKAGGIWQSVAYKTVAPKNGRAIACNDATDFARFARANGRADLANFALKSAVRSRKIQALEGPKNGRYQQQLWLRRSNLGRWMYLFEGLPFVLAGNLIYLALWWLCANFCLWRARAAPSSRRDRMGLGLATTLCLIPMGLLALWFVLQSSGGTLSPLGALMGSWAAFAFFGTPFVLALSCGLLTMRRQRARFGLPPRLDTELALSPWQRAFLRWFLPAGVLAVVALFVASWVLWLLATARGWNTVDLLKLLPPDRNGTTNSLLWDSTGSPLLVYSLVLCAGCLLLWFWRWRWAMPPDLRPFTQSALRWWKESLGVAAVALSWIFLVIALSALPLFQRAEVQLERVFQVGELQVK